ncbi:MAG: hypothetical protein JWN84_3896 [Nocardioides sp.]|nr:hypothetical protein [Nocardioides sp.]
MSRPLDVVAALTQVSQDLSDLEDLDTTLQRLVSVACASVPLVDHVGVSVASAGAGAPTAVASDDVARALDALQHELGEGPCLQAVAGGGERVRVDRWAEDRRWPRVRAAAVDLDVRSCVVVPVRVDGRPVGALALWSTDALPEETEQLAELFAAQAGLALGHARRIENLNAALQSRTVIGLALGIVMQRLDIDEDTAFAYLTRVSATTETKLRDVAAAMVREHHEHLLTRRGGSDETGPA